jgi:hypothetical protein
LAASFINPVLSETNHPKRDARANSSKSESEGILFEAEC